jgi:hypothetical protein
MVLILWPTPLSIVHLLYLLVRIMLLMLCVPLLTLVVLILVPLTALVSVAIIVTSIIILPCSPLLRSRTWILPSASPIRFAICVRRLSRLARLVISSLLLAIVPRSGVGSSCSRGRYWRRTGWLPSRCCAWFRTHFGALT